MLKYNDLINFVLAHEFFLELLETHHKRLFEVLKLPLVCRITKLLIDQRAKKLFFWKELLKSYNQKRPYYVELSFGYDYVAIDIKETNNLYKKCTERFKTMGNITAEAIVNLCIWNPNLRVLSLKGTEIHGSISDIAPHCGNLEKLRIMINPRSSAAQFALFAKLPNLKTFIITGIQQSGSSLLFFNDLRKWCRPKSLQPLTLAIEYCKCDKRQSTAIEIFDALRCFRMYKLYEHLGYNFARCEYDLHKIPEAKNLVQESPETFPLYDGVQMEFERYEGELVLNIDKDSGLSQMGCFSKLPNLSHLVIKNTPTYVKERNSLAKLFQLMVPKGTFALKSCIIQLTIDRLESIELAKVESIRFLECHLSEWESIKYLCKLTNLQHVLINVCEPINSNTSELVFNLLSACRIKAEIACKDFKLKMKGRTVYISMKRRCNVDPFSSFAQPMNISTLSVPTNTYTLNQLFEAFATSNVNSIEELFYESSENIRFEDISKLTEIQTIRKLTCPALILTGIEKLAELNNLEDLYITGKGNLAALFTKLAEKNKIKSIRLDKQLVPEEVLRVSEIKSLKKLHCSFFNTQDLQSLSALAKSSIEELIVDPSDSLQNLFAAFSSNSTTRLQHLKINYKNLTITEMSEISKITNLKKLSARFFNAECTQMLVRLANLEHLVIKNVLGYEISPLEHLLWDSVHKSPITLRKLDLKVWIGFNECNSLTQLETLESLSCKLNKEPGIEILANINKLKELIIYKAEGSLIELFRAFALKSESTLQELQTPIICSDEIREISHIESLLKLIIYNKRENKFICLNPSNGHNSLTIDSNIFLPIFQSCQKLDCVTVDFEFGVAMAFNFVSEVNTILKSIRDPLLQKPLKLALRGKSTLHSKLHLEDIDEAFLTVFCYTYKSDLYTTAGLLFDYSESDSDDSDVSDQDEYENLINNFNLLSG
ncbi:uncharacterized protein LOC108051055 isoform X1 [Drosophila rhopaloa]|uniref:Uncharacterized protein LOC108051055 isoform X1 n=1 Tax=Drosophila rhopaloa TaxID=1041015 RepID=A0A6P4FDK2_DRORH|nr:uncharacterized protein LOC108051055 isoform X1 [Drosophila rhopaloa]